MTHNGVVAARGRLTDWISLGVLASSVPWDAVDEAVTAAAGPRRPARGRGLSNPRIATKLLVYGLP
jgi:hypothetical protein